MCLRVWPIRFLFLAAFSVSRTACAVPEGIPTIDCSCGVQKSVGTRIVGGESAVLNEFPWQVQLLYINHFYCGGSLINSLYVLTAAHCVKGIYWPLIQARLGAYDQCDSTEKSHLRFVRSATLNGFNPVTYDRDIALLKLNKKVTFSDSVSPICLTSASKISEIQGKTATVSGWGRTKENSRTACVLQKVSVPILSMRQCRQTKYGSAAITANMLCAGYPSGKKDACQGDSGGPLVLAQPYGVSELIGVVSWGIGCGLPKYPGVYASVAYFKDWIYQNTQDAEYCGL